MLHKDKYLTQIEAGTITIKEDCSLTEPVIYIKTSNDIKNVNYMKMGDFYYYVRVELMPGGSMHRIIGKRDVLTSFKDEILKINAIVDKNQYESNMYLNDGSFITEARENIEIVNFSSGFSDSGSFILIAAGG